MTETTACAMPDNRRSIAGHIRLRGVSTHNLKCIDLDIPHGQWLVLCGLSGSGKSSLAIDTLLAEGQRRFIETFSPATRAYLQKWEKPDAESIDGIPAAVSVQASAARESPWATVGDISDCSDYLRFIFSSVAKLSCPDCDREVNSFSPETACRDLVDRFAGRRAMIGFGSGILAREEVANRLAAFQLGGFRRVRTGEVSVRIEDAIAGIRNDQPVSSFDVIVDRMTIDINETGRLSDSIRTAMTTSGVASTVWIESATGTVSIDQRLFHQIDYRNRPECPSCGKVFPRVEPAIFDPGDPRGACPECEGTGRKPGAANQRESEPCPICHGTRLNPVSLGWKLAGNRFADLANLAAERLDVFLSGETESVGLRLQQDLELAEAVGQLRRRLSLLIDAGLGYLELSRFVRDLGRGERHRALFVRIAGLSIVNLLVVLDEFSSGLHPADVERMIPQFRRLKARGNTIVMAEHNLQVLAAADRVVELGPGAGVHGGKIVFDGNPMDLAGSKASLTGQYLSGQRGWNYPTTRRTRRRGSIRLFGASGNNLRAIDVEFPLGLLCVVTGVSGAGKSSLVRQTLVAGLWRKSGRTNTPHPLPFSELRGSDLVDDVVMIDSHFPLRTARSNPSTFTGAFELIRKVFAETADARLMELKPGHFSFNVPGGRCETCRGEGVITIDMQFLADIRTRCEDCRGKRFGPRVLEVRYRDRTISDVLEMTCDEAFGFFRGQRKLQKQLQQLREAGLGYLALGQPLSTLSAGETQRLKLAAFLARRSSKRTLFVVDEPAANLHSSEVPSLLRNMNALVDVGHSIIVIEHHPLVMAWADWLIDIGPGPASRGGTIVACGTPEQVADAGQGETARFLKAVLCHRLDGEN
jgi:excinuclease ABC subunit A